jgi:hypothetical protein
MTAVMSGSAIAGTVVVGLVPSFLFTRTSGTFARIRNIKKRQIMQKIGSKPTAIGLAMKLNRAEELDPEQRAAVAEFIRTEVEFFMTELQEMGWVCRVEPDALREGISGSQRPAVSVRETREVYTLDMIRGLDASA